MSESLKVAVIGCGIFGAMTALRLADHGLQVSIFERQLEPLKGASYNNQNRLHLGFHYPRDDETGRQSIRGFATFRQEFPECILDGFRNAYFVASEGSLVTAQQYLEFCRRMDLAHEVFEPSTFEPEVNHVDVGVLTQEVVYDSAILGQLVLDRLRRAGIQPIFGTEVVGIERRLPGFRLAFKDRPDEDFDVVVNCTYAAVNLLTEQLGHAVPEYLYEYTVVPVIEWDHANVGVSIMDGPFMTVLPFGQTGRFLLYHVAHSVIDAHIGKHMPSAWRDRSTSPARTIDSAALFEKIRKSCCHFVPALETVRCVDFLEGPRMVLAYQDSTDTRPSIVKELEAGYITAFTGKIDHCIWVAEDIARMILDREPVELAESA